MITVYYHPLDGKVEWVHLEIDGIPHITSDIRNYYPTENRLSVFVSRTTKITDDPKNTNKSSLETCLKYSVGDEDSFYEKIELPDTALVEFYNDHISEAVLTSPRFYNGKIKI